MLKAKVPKCDFPFQAVTTATRFLCSTCYFPTGAALLQAKMFKCKFPGCDYSQKAPYWIKQHEKIHSSDPNLRRPHECQYCGYRSSSKYKLKDHVLLHTDGQKFACSVSSCNYRTHNKDYLVSHKKRHNAPHLFCAFKGCSYKNKSNSKLKAHVAIHHTTERKKDVKCPFCPKTYYRTDNLYAHLLTHTNEKPSKCSMCSYETKFGYELNVHRKDIHGQFLKSGKLGLHKCELCDYSTSAPGKLKRHLASHSDERPYACTFPGCNHRYKRLDSLKIHTTSAHTPTYHHCPEPDCAYVTKTKHLLGAHRRVHKKLFPCHFPGCNRQCHSEVTLLNHQRFHDPNRKLQCVHCPLRFPTKSTLKHHIESVHGQGKRLQCPHCNKYSSSKYSLVGHIKLVHRVENTSCSRPGCTFKGSLAQSISATVDVLRHKCKFCDCTFVDPHELIKHEIFHRGAIVILNKLDVFYQ